MSDGTAGHVLGFAEELPRALKVGDVCKDQAQLRVGMTVQWQDPWATGKLEAPLLACEDGVWYSSFAAFHPSYVALNGLTILALPEEARTLDVANGDLRPSVTTPSCDLNIGATIAAPSLESLVPVGSRWRLNAAELTTFRVVHAAPQFSAFNVKYDGMNTLVNLSLDWILAHATRIDEPARAELPAEFVAKAKALGESFAKALAKERSRPAMPTNEMPQDIKPGDDIEVRVYRQIWAPAKVTQVSPPEFDAEVDDGGLVSMDIANMNDWRRPGVQQKQGDA